MGNAAEELKRVENLPEPQIGHEEDRDECPHGQGGMPRLWLIVLVVEYNKAHDDVGNDSRSSCAGDDPGTDSQPS